MIRKIGVLGLAILCIATFICCEEDFNNIGSSIINNTKFDTNSVDLEVVITPVDVDKIKVNNSKDGIAITEYWLGVYNSQNYKTIKSSIISQLNYIKNPKTADKVTTDAKGDIDSTYILDDVILKLPYQATSKGANDDGILEFRLDSVLGNTEIPTSLEVWRNGTFLNSLNPADPSQANTFYANDTYIEQELLNKDAGFTFMPNPIDTVYTVTRHHGDGSTFESKETLSNKHPFLSIPLNVQRMKELFWDKFDGTEFSSPEEFNNYFRGLILKAQGSNGSMVPLNLAATTESASVEFYYTITRREKLEDGASFTHKDTIPTKYSFPLSGIRNAKYETSPGTNTLPAENFRLQGTTGSMAQVKVLGVNLAKLKAEDPDNLLLKHENKDTNPQDGYLSLQEMASIRDLANENFGIIVNDASLSLYINQTVDTDKNILPLQLTMYKGEAAQGVDPITKLTEIVNPEQISDAYLEGATFNIALDPTDEEKSEKYDLRISNYISNLLNGSSDDFSLLFLKVYNPASDNPFRSNSLQTNMLSYNWNPRGVTLLNENEAAHGDKRAVLKLYYSEKK